MSRPEENVHQTEHHLSAREQRLGCSSTGETILAKSKRRNYLPCLHRDKSMGGDTWNYVPRTATGIIIFMPFPTHFLKLKSIFSLPLQWNDRQVNFLGCAFQRDLVFCWQQLAFFQMEPSKLGITEFAPCLTCLVAPKWETSLPADAPRLCSWWAEFKLIEETKDGSFPAWASFQTLNPLEQW